MPLIVTGPEVARGRTTAALVQNTDLDPTFSQLAGAHVPHNVDGHSLLGLLDGRRRTRWREVVLIEHHGTDNNPLDPDFPAADSGNPTS